MRLAAGEAVTHDSIRRTIVLLAALGLAALAGCTTVKTADAPVGVLSTPPSAAAPEVGSSITVANNNRVIVRSVISDPPLTKLGGLAAPSPSAGNVYIGLDVEGCAQKANTLSMDGLWWHLVDAAGNDYAVSLFASTAAATPLSTVSEYVPVGQCSRGTLIFEVPAGTQVAQVLYNPTPFEKDYWKVS